MLPLFRGLREADVAWLARRGTCRTLSPGWVYRQDRPAESLFVLLAGFSYVSHRGRPGDVVG